MKKNKSLATEVAFWGRFVKISRLERKINTTVRNLLNVTTNDIKKTDEKRCRWYVHIKRIESDRLPKLFMNWEPEGRNGRCSKKRWRDNLREGLERYGLRGIENNGRTE